VPMAGTSIGAHRTCTVLGLQPATDYQFQLVAFRGTLNVDAAFGDLSNVASGTTNAGTPPPAVSLAFTSEPPPNLVLNGSFSVEVTGRDNQGQTAATFSGLVTVTLQGSGVATLSGQNSVNAVNGIATFNNLSVTGLCTGCTLVASSPGLSSATSSPFNVASP
jgi:hypothetical protein